MRKRVIAEGTEWELVWWHERTLWFHSKPVTLNYAIHGSDFLVLEGLGAKWHLYDASPKGPEQRLEVLARHLQCSSEEEVRRRIEILMRLAGIDV